MHAPVHGRELTHDERGKASQRVTLVGAVVNLLLSVLKIVVGVIGQSQALVADGVHSLSDLASDVLVWFAAGQANQAPDEEHPYGHGRFETAATLGLGILLGIIGIGVVWDAFERLIFPEDLWIPKQIALYAALVSVIAKEALYWYTVRVADQVNSKMLRANAWHHRTDAISSVVVLIGVGGALLGFPYLDAIAAIAVGLMIIHIGWELGFEAIEELVDKALDDQKVQEIRTLIEDIDGVRSLHMLRTRRHGHVASADVHVLVSPWLSVSEGHMLAVKVEEVLKAGVDEITDVTVHIDPEDDEEAPPCKGLPLRAEVFEHLNKAWADLPCFQRHKRVLLHYLAGRIDVELFLPFDCVDSCDDANKLRDRFRDGLADNPLFRRVDLHFSDHL